jgi:radical SAM protein with 4Fe4S-binding SPASM domain
VGKVYPCVVWRDELGDLTRAPLGEALRSPRAGQIRDLKAGDLKECATCRLARWCVRCPGLAALEAGSPVGPSPSSCRLAALSRELQNRAGAEIEVPT